MDTPTQQLRDIRGPLPLVPEASWPWILGIISGIVILAALAYWVRAKMAAKQTQAQRATAAQRALHALKAANTSANAADALRSWLAASTHIPATEQTSAELLNSLKKLTNTTNLRAENITTVQQLLAAADAEKFAQQPGKQTHMHVQSILEWVRSGAFEANDTAEMGVGAHTKPSGEPNAAPGAHPTSNQPNKYKGGGA